MSERLIWQGQKQEKIVAAKQLESSIKGVRETIRANLNPHMPISSIDPEMIQQQALELADKVVRYNALCSEIEAINRSLGIV